MHDWHWKPGALFGHDTKIGIAEDGAWIGDWKFEFCVLVTTVIVIVVVVVVVVVTLAQIPL